MVVLGIHGAAGEPGSVDGEGILRGFRSAAQGFDHGDGGCHPVGFLDAQPPDVGEDRTVIGCRHDRKDGHQIGNIGGGNGGVPVPELVGDVHDRPVALDGFVVESVDA